MISLEMKIKEPRTLQQLLMLLSLVLQQGGKSEGGNLPRR